jgi:phosphoribosylformylglycinamidine synthase
VLGLIDNLDRRPPGIHLTAGSNLVLIGASTLDSASLAGSRWAVEHHEFRGGTLPLLDLAAHRRLLDLVAALANDVDGLLTGVHDISDGGLGVALAEMAIRSGTGFEVAGVADHAALFSEAPSRVVVCTDDPDVVARAAEDAGVPTVRLGRTGGKRLVVDGIVDLTVAAATAAWQDALPLALGTT